LAPFIWYPSLPLEEDKANSFFSMNGLSVEYAWVKDVKQI